jgi:hypothetical protein
MDSIVLIVAVTSALAGVATLVISAAHHYYTTGKQVIGTQGCQVGAYLVDTVFKVQLFAEAYLPQRRTLTVIIDDDHCLELRCALQACALSSGKFLPCPFQAAIHTRVIKYLRCPGTWHSASIFGRGDECITSGHFWPTRHCDSLAMKLVAQLSEDG